MKKILILSTIGTSIIDYRITSQAIFLKQNGFDVTVLELAPLTNPDFNLNNNYKLHNINFLYVLQNPIFAFMAKFKFNNIQNKIIREVLRPIKKPVRICVFYIARNFLKQTIKKYKPDVVISRDTTPFLKLINKDIKIVNDLHEVYYFQAAKISEHLKAKQENSLKRASFIINVTPQIAQSFYKDFWDKRNSIIIPNTPILSLLPSTVPIFTKSDKVRLLIHGSYIKHRDKMTKKIILSFIEAPKNATLYVRFLNANSAGVIDLKKEILQVDKNNKIVFLNPIESGVKEEVESMINNFDIGIISLDTSLSPLYKMASPNRLGTYMHAGLAIVSSQSDFVAEVVKSANCGLIYENDKILDCVNLICQNPEMLLNMKENAFKFAKSTFNYDNYGKQLLEKLNSL